MADMLKMFVKQEISNLIKSKYPHMEYPTGVCAKVTRATDIGGKFKYNLKILDKNMHVDDDLPEIPGVISEYKLKKNEIAVVIRLYGGTNYYIVGRWDGS